MNSEIFNKELDEKTNEVARLRKALELIAAPMRPDGTYNRDRRACELLAKEALAPASEEPVSEGTRIASELRSSCNDMTSEERKRYAALAEDVIKLHRPDKELSPALEEAAERLAEKTSDVARLKEEIERFKRGCQGSCYVCEPVGEMNLKLEAEVERLRELCENLDEYTQHDRLCPISSCMFAVCECGLKELREELAALATAPEEPVIQDSRITEPEWRELGPDEIIQEGDEIQWPEKDWQTAKSSVGYKVGYWDGLVKARTLRPLPKQEEMPLEDELKDIDQYADKQNDFYTCRVFQSIEYSLHYLRDEIQKLKCL